MAFGEMRRWIAGAVAVLLLAGGAWLWSRPGNSGMALAAPTDAGRTIPPDAEAAALVAPVSGLTPADKEARRFNRYDKDRDGEITRDEYLASRRKAYAKLDLDGDGKLSFDEYTARAAKKFATADTSRDAALNPVEFATTAVVRRARTAVSCPPAVADAGRDDEG